MIMKIKLNKPGPILRQYIIVIIANFTMMHMGLTTSWLSPVLVKLRDANETVLPEPVTDSQGAWIVSLGSLVALSAMTFTSLLANNLGRKNTLIIACLIRIAMCIIFLVASQVWMIILGRCLGGISDFISISVTTTYSSEIASKEIRGAMGTLTQILSALGGMLMLSIGPFVSYISLNIFLICIVFATSVPILFLPETPHFLHSKGKIEETIKVLTFVRGTETKAREEIMEYDIKTETIINLKEVLSDKVLLKTFGMIIVMSIFVQFIGYNAVTINLQTILILTNTSVRPEISSVIIGCIELFACFCTIILTDRFGRKPMMAFSLIGVALGMIGLGIFFTLTEEGLDIVGFLNYLPLISIILIAFCYNSGAGPLLWMLLAELCDGRFRAFGVSTGVMCSSFFVFIILRFFPAVTNSIGPANTYWIFSGFGAFLCIFVVFCVPETKGRTFYEIQKALGRKDFKN